MPDAPLPSPIFTPGVADGMPAEVYHAIPALGSSGAWTLETECPALYWHASAFNPLYQPEHKREFDIGNATHLLALEPGLFEQRVAVVDADDYRTKAAKEARDAARAAGRIPLLPGEHSMVVAMRAAIQEHPVARHAFTGGVAERSIFWRDPATGAPCKARPDYLPPHARYLPDLKTSTTANPEAFARKVADLGYHMRAAFYMEGLRVATGETPAKAAFIVICKKPPHLVSVCWLDDDALAWGRLQARRAIDTFARCLDRGEWPGYRLPETPDKDGAFTVRLPPWVRRSLDEQHQAGQFQDAYHALVEAGAPFNV